MSLDAFSVKGKTIMVTGSSSGIGYEIARQLDKDGAKLVLVGRSKEVLISVASSFISNPILIQQDLTKIDELEAMVKLLKNEVVDLHGLVHSAGVSPTKPMNLVNENLVKETFDINVMSVIELSKNLYKYYRNTLSSLVYMSSVASFLGVKAKSIYALSKGALVAFAKSQALEYVKYGIRVNCVAPSVVETPLTSNAIYKRNSDSLKKALEQHPLGFGFPEDVAYSVIFLLSDASRWITGTNMIVDGGYSIQ